MTDGATRRIELMNRLKQEKRPLVRNGTGKGVWREPPGDRAGHRTVACDQPQYSEHK